ncbi:MAG: family 10 glycosylhydrolase [Armatimonadetes bacterium]|nr:family 10 glycosylhydrolase [Armatimonadota bacterium]
MLKTTICLAIILLPALTAAVIAEPQFKVRAIWVDTGSFATREKADDLLDQCRRAKINLILPNVMAHGSVMHKSSHFLHNVAANDKLDPLAYLTEKAHGLGIEVHAWYCVYYEGVKGLAPGHPDWICTDMDGKRMDQTYFLSPQVPGVNDYLLSVMRDGLAYDIDGVHLDYIRYYGTPYDYSELGLERFIEAGGFDPRNFLDGGERLVKNEPFPLRVMHSERHKSRVWEQTWVESLMDRSGVGFSFISEKPELVDALRAPGCLVLSTYYNSSPEMTAAIERYVERGGSVVCIDGLTSGENPELHKLFGVKPESKWRATGWRTITAEGSHPLTKCLPREALKVNVNGILALDGGQVVARFDSGEPAVIVNGRAVLVCFNACTSPTSGPPRMVRGIVEWLRSESGVTSGADPMRARRVAWIRWKCNRIAELVRGVREAVKAKNPKLAVSAAGGFNANEPYTVSRDGQAWLNEGLMDFVCPMDYFDDIRELKESLDLHRASVTPDQLSTFYPGLSLYTSKSIGGKRTTVSQDARIIKQQLDLLRKEGHRGFTLFCSAQLNDAQIKVIATAAR